MKEKKGLHPIYYLAGFYVIMVYLVPILFTLVTKVEFLEKMGFPVLFFPVILGIINTVIIVVNKDKIGRERLLNCTIFMKYTMIPFYIVGGCMIAVFALLTFTPVVIMIFIGPTMVAILSVLGWLFMVGGSPFSIAYILESKKQKVHGTILSIIATILQFFFWTDVISIMVLSLKEKKCVKATIAMIIVLAVGFLAIIGIIAFLIVAGMAKSAAAGMIF